MGIRRLIITDWIAQRIEIKDDGERFALICWDKLRDERSTTILNPQEAQAIADFINQDSKAKTLQRS